MIYIIAAKDENNVIGYNGNLPWNYPEDLAFFRKQTTGCKIIMGLNTFNSIKKPLKNRQNYVASQQPVAIEGVIVVNDAVAFFQKYQNHEDIVFVIGGESIYRQALPYTQKMFLTKIPGIHPGDTYFPKFGEEFVLSETITLEQLIVEVFVRA